MTFSDSHEEMPSVEQHGIQLRMATDMLETRTDTLAFEGIVAVFAAEDLLADIIATNKLLQRR